VIVHFLLDSAKNNQTLDNSFLAILMEIANLLPTFYIFLNSKGTYCMITSIIVFIIYYQAKIVVVNEDKILKYLTIDLFVLTYFFNDMHFMHACWYWCAFFALRADIGNCDVAYITPCKWCINLDIVIVQGYKYCILCILIVFIV
jgi:hypothetical protein